MNWKDLLRAQGYTDAEITKMETEFGGDKMAKAFAAPLAAQQAAETALATAKTEHEEFEKFYNDDVLPKVSTVYQDAINWRTRATALEERLKAAKDYGFLSEPTAIAGAVPGMPAGTPIAAPVNPVPGSPAAPGAPTPAAMDPRYVSVDTFKQGVDSIPDMLGRLTKMSNEHFSLFGSPLLDVDTLITEAKSQKKNVLDVWQTKYKVQERRDEIKRKVQEDHDRQVGEEAVRKYASDHGQPFTAPGRPSVASHFTPTSSDEARHPWKGAADRKRDRAQKLMQEFTSGGKPKSAVQ